MIAEKGDSIQDNEDTLLPHYSLWCHWSWNSRYSGEPFILRFQIDTQLAISPFPEIGRMSRDWVRERREEDYGQPVGHRKNSLKESLCYFDQYDGQTTQWLSDHPNQTASLVCSAPFSQNPFFHKLPSPLRSSEREILDSAHEIDRGGTSWWINFIALPTKMEFFIKGR